MTTSREQLLENGELARMIADGEIYGVTSNPSIFNNAIAKSNDYDADLLPLLADGKSPMEVFEALAVKDIQAACDLFADLYQKTNGGDGYVSLEVNPDLAHDTEGTVAEAKQLWRLVDRPNLMVKIPATLAGHPRRGAGHCCRDQCKCHPDLLPGALPDGHGGLYRRSGAAHRCRPAGGPNCLGSFLLRFPYGFQSGCDTGRYRHKYKPKP